VTARVFVSVDMEGVAGVATFDQVIRGGSGYPRAQQLMTDEANAAIRGAFAGGATEVLVNDSHGTMDNLVAERLDPRATLLAGAPRPSCMVQGVRAGDVAAVFVGYHAGAGASGVLAHTFSANFTELRVTGVAMTEAEVNGLYAGAHGVPVAVVTGDDEICDVARKAFTGVAAVAVKTATGYSAAESLAPGVAADLIEAAVAGAVRAAAAGELAAEPIPAELVLEVDFASALLADYAATVPRTERPGPRTLRGQVDDVEDLMRLVMAWYYLAALGAQQYAALAFRR
jgi:D-amino peptidase